MLAQLEKLATLGIKITFDGEWFAVSAIEDKGVLPCYDYDLRDAVDAMLKEAQERWWL